MDYRQFDPILGRMNGVDPMADKYSSLTPYNYSFNAPTMHTDASGADPDFEPNYFVEESMQRRAARNRGDGVDLEGTLRGSFNPLLQRATSLDNLRSVGGWSAGGSISRGSGNHWADGLSEYTTNWGLMFNSTFTEFYKDELSQILKKQIELQPDLFSNHLYNDCVRELYRNNEAHQFQLSKRDFLHLFIYDIIFYQRPLGSQKSSISNCTLEFKKYKDAEGVEHVQYLKAIPKSNPYYQEYRMWQWIYNLSIYKKDDDSNVSAEFLNGLEDWESLFEFLNDRKEVEHQIGLILRKPRKIRH